MEIHPDECVAEYDDGYDGSRIPGTCPCPECLYEDADADDA